jgi:6-phosphogluconolactonase
MNRGCRLAREQKMQQRRLSGLWLCVSVVLAVVVAGCANFWKLPSDSGGGGTTSTTLSSGVFYVVDQTTSQLNAYSISSGTLESVSGSPYALPATPITIAVSSTGGYLYLATINGIYLYTIGSGGSLTLANNNNPISSDITSAMAVSGSWLVDAFITASGNVQLDAIPINSSTGLYAGSGGTPPLQSFALANAKVMPNQLVISPDGTNLFVALGAGGTLVVPFTAGNSNPIGATETTIGLASSNSEALSVAVDPTNRLLYVGQTNANSNSNPGGLFVFNYSTLGTGSTRSVPTQISGSPIATGGSAPNAILPVASGEYVYVANGGSNTESGNVAWFPITVSGSTYTIASGSNISSGIQPIALAEDSEDNFVLAVSTGGSTSSGDPDLEAYTISSGALTAAITSTTGTDPVGASAIVALP